MNFLIIPIDNYDTMYFDTSTVVQRPIEKKEKNLLNGWLINRLTLNCC